MLTVTPDPKPCREKGQVPVRGDEHGPACDAAKEAEEGGGADGLNAVHAAVPAVVPPSLTAWIIYTCRLKRCLTHSLSIALPHALLVYRVRLWFKIYIYSGPFVLSDNVQKLEDATSFVWYAPAYSVYCATADLPRFFEARNITSNF